MKVDQRIQALRASGFRITRARYAILLILDEAKIPCSVPEIQNHLIQRGVHINKTTVYREILFLVQKCILAEVNFGDEAKYYELIDGEHHHHFVCLSCRSVKELSIEKNLIHILQTVSDQTGGHITRHMVEFFGTCSSCKTALI